MPAVWALRQAGAVILGKTVTAELGGSHPGADHQSVRSGAHAGRLVVRLGGRGRRQHGAGGDRHPGRRLDHPAGRLLRQLRAEADAGRHQPRRAAGDQHEHARRRTPAASRTCGRSRSRSPSAAAATAARSGLIGPRHPARGDQARPADRAGDRRLGRRRRRDQGGLRPSCWSSSRRAGVTLIRRGDHPFVESAGEGDRQRARASATRSRAGRTAGTSAACSTPRPDGLSERAKATLLKAEAMTPDDYRTSLLARQAAQLAHAAVAPLADAAITLSCPGPAPLWSGDVPGQPLAPRPTGDFVFNAPSSMLFAPVVTVPLMSVGGMPVGVQLMGQQHEDARMTGIARWMTDNCEAGRGGMQSAVSRAERGEVGSAHVRRNGGVKSNTHRCCGLGPLSSRMTAPPPRACAQGGIAAIRAYSGLMPSATIRGITDRLEVPRSPPSPLRGSAASR